MKKFISVEDVSDLDALVQSALSFKKDPYKDRALGENKTMGLIFLNPSLRTRLSTHKAAAALGMDVMLMNIGSDGWALETAEGVIMNGNTAEHVREAAPVIGAYCDVIGIRSFPALKNKEEDYQDIFIQNFVQHAGVPIVSLESATRHPLQSLADLVTIEETKTKAKPKVVLSWAPHPRALPQSVPNSFAEWMNVADVDLVITHPEGYDLAEEFVGNATVEYNQENAFDGADYIYAKNWSSYKDYGQKLSEDMSWVIDEHKMSLTDNGKFMHCLPVRRNVIVTDAVIESANSLVVQEAENRLYAAQAVIKEILINS